MNQAKILRPPRAVVIAVILFSGSHAINDIVRISEFGIPLQLSYFIALAMVWVPVLLISAAAYRGKNWGRMLISGFTVFGAYYLPWSLPPVMGTQFAVMQLAQGTLCIVATILLFMPAARLWYRSRKQLATMPTI
jgi:cellobiose-specific phosphotransferase system component IIC